MELFTYRATLINVVDGDTVDLKVDMGFDVHFGLRVRLEGINTPEIFGVHKDTEDYKKGVAAKAFLQDILTREAKNLVVKTAKDKQEKYGRYLATLFILGADGQPGKESINDMLIRLGHAVAYDGTGKVK
jgi:micrococcal nuclease